MKKNVLIVVGMFIVNIFNTTVVNAQYYNNDQIVVSTEAGSGLFNLGVQGETNLRVIKQNFMTALFGEVHDAEKIFRSDLCDKGFSPHDLLLLQSDWLTRQLDGFDATNQSDYDISFDWENPEWWGGYYDGYVIANNDKNLHWSDPLKSRLLKYKKPVLVATIKKLSNGKIAKVIAKCGNPATPRGTGTYNEPIYEPSQVPTDTIATASVIFAKPDRFEDLNRRNSISNTQSKKGWFSRNACWVVPVAAVLVGGTIYMFTKKAKDNSYNNGWIHDSNTSPWPAGSGGGGTTGQTF